MDGGGGGGGAGIPPRNLEIEYGYYISFYMLLNISMYRQNVVWKILSQIAVRSDLRGCKLMPQTPVVGTHAFHTVLSSCYHPFSPHNSKSCMYNFVFSTVTVVH